MIRKPIVSLVLAMVLASCAQHGGLSVIPAPSVNQTDGRLVSVGSKVVAAEGLESEAAMLADSLQALCSSGRKVILSIDGNLAEEEYVLTVSRCKVRIEGGSSAGVFYGMQTLLQELQANGGKALRGVIKDAPEYSWRGYMLDESRHFFGMEVVKELLDFMARYKLNKFHWHLTDAPGWRIEIKAYPELTRVGALGDLSNPGGPAAFYTQDQIKEVIEYAAARHIEVIPEIDMPGHVSSATRSYPELGPGTAPGPFTYNPAKEEVYDFISNMLKEVAELFPSEYLHIGDDEVAMGRDVWASDPEIKALMKREGYTDLKQVEAYFLRRVAPIVHGLGKKILGWDDILDLKDSKQADILTWWRHERPDHLVQAREQGYGVILCPRLPLYFDFVQDESHESGRKWYTDGDYNDLKDVYDFPESLYATSPDNDMIIGMQANLWTETLRTHKRVQFMTFPRIAAMAEDAWTSAANKNYDSFLSRLEKEYEVYDKYGIYYCDFRDLDHHPEVKH